MQKRIFSIFLILLFVFSFVACGNQAENPTESTKGESLVNNEESEESTNMPKPSNIDENDVKKAAVIYFSATGTTKKVAQLIADEADAELFEIVPKKLYTPEDLSYNNDNCRANREMNNENARPEISNDLSSVSDYNTIYLGYPIWWGTAPRVIQTFIERYDLSGKTIYLFCTSGSSGIEQSVQDLNNLYPNLNIVSGKRLNQATKENIQAWLSELRSSK